MADRSSEPEPLLHPVEALIHIRAIVEESANLIYGTKAEPAMREITEILDRALSSRRKRPTEESSTNMRKAAPVLNSIQ